MKKAIIIGFGGMGIRHYKALKKLNIDVIGVCDQNLEKLNSFKFLKKIKKVKDYKKLINIKADVVCVASNTKSRYQIIRNFIINSKIERMLIEKPLCTSFKECKKLEILIKKYKNKKKVYVNTFRTISKNFENVRNLFKKNNEKITHVFINSPSAGLGNMGSIFFDLGNYYLNDKATSVTSWIDKTGTISPRGEAFKDPGGYGVVKYQNNKKLFFDLSENTALPYEIILKSQNFECKIDELNNEYTIRKKPLGLKSKPNYYYLYKPDKFKLKPKHKYDVVLMTTFSIKKLFSNKFQSNINESLKSMEIVFACHASDQNNRTVKLPLKKDFHNKKINFA
jgi:hypothetical protein